MRLGRPRQRRPARPRFSPSRAWLPRQARAGRGLSPVVPLVGPRLRCRSLSAPSSMAERGNFTGTSHGRGLAGPWSLALASWPAPSWAGWVPSIHVHCPSTSRSLSRSPSRLHPRVRYVTPCPGAATLARAPPMMGRAATPPAVSRAWPHADPSLWHALAILRGNTHVAKRRSSAAAHWRARVGSWAADPSSSSTARLGVPGSLACAPDRATGAARRAPSGKRNILSLGFRPIARPLLSSVATAGREGQPQRAGGHARAQDSCAD